MAVQAAGNATPLSRGRGIAYYKRTRKVKTMAKSAIGTVWALTKVVLLIGILYGGYLVYQHMMVERARDACMCTAITCITVGEWLPNYRPYAWRGQFGRALLGLDH